MKKIAFASLIVGLLLTIGTVAVAHETDVGYSIPKIEKNDIISVPVYDLQTNLPAISPDAMCRDVGYNSNIPTDQDMVGYPAREIVVIMRTKDNSPVKYFIPQRRRSIDRSYNHTRPPNDPVPKE